MLDLFDQQGGPSPRATPKQAPTEHDPPPPASLGVPAMVAEETADDLPEMPDDDGGASMRDAAAAAAGAMAAEPAAPVDAN